MKYTSDGIKEAATNVEITTPSEISIESLRYVMFNKLMETDRDLLGPKVISYLGGLDGINSFWSVREILDFQSTFFLIDNNDLLDLLENDLPSLYTMLEKWLTIGEDRNKAASSGICRRIAEAENKVNRVISNVAVAKNLYDSLKEDLEGGDMLESAKSMVNSILGTHVEQIRNKIQNINNLIKKIDPVHKSVTRKVLKIRDEMESMTSDDVVESLKDQIQGQLGFTMSQFEKLDGDAIRHIMDRACSISGNISKPFERKAAQIDSISSYYSGTTEAIRSSSALTTQNAINAGAYRYNSSSLDQRIPQIRENQQQATEAIPGGIYDAPPSQEEIDGVTMWNEGRGDSRIGFSGQWVTKVGQEGWIRVDHRARVKLMRLQKMFGRKLTVNSGYRPPAYNASIKGAKNSCHIKGHALDITWSGFNASSKAEFIKMARACGFTGLGVNYNTFVHIDIGTPRTW